MLQHFIPLIMLSGLLVAAGCAPVQRTPPGSDKAGPQSKTAELKLPSLSPGDGEFDLAGKRGEVVLLDFWATWCAPCVAELPSLNALHEELADRGFSLVGLALDKGERSAVTRAVQDLGPVYPVAWANTDVQAAYGGVRVVPTKVLLNRDGVVVKRYAGVVDTDLIRQDVEALLAE